MTAVLYIGSRLPSRSETFVYREVLSLRARRIRVACASVHPPEQGLGDAQLDALASDAVVVYGHGVLRLARDACAQSFRSPTRAVRTLCLGLGDAMFGAGVPITKRPKVLWQTLAGLSLAYRAPPVDHIHAHLAHVPTAIAMYAASALGVPFSFTGHANDIFQGPVLLRSKIRRAAFVACISVWHAGFYRGICDRPDDVFPIVRCGVDVGGTPTLEDRSIGVLAIGRAVAKKGFDRLLRAVASIPAPSRPRTVIAGDGPELGRLKALAVELALGDTVDFVGAVTHAQAIALQARAVLFVLPCVQAGDGDRDGIPVVLMEAMAAGACVVSGDLPTIRELIDDGQTGRLVNAEDTVELGRVIVSLLADTSRRARLVESARERIREEFSTDINTTRLIRAAGWLPETQENVGS